MREFILLLFRFVASFFKSKVTLQAENLVSFAFIRTYCYH